jgi:hypothetical protein
MSSSDNRTPSPHEKHEKRDPRGMNGGSGGGGQTEKTSGSAPTKDITPLLKGWDYEPGTINVRKISGSDGQPKVQMRLELGLLQMELTGRPDGAKPHGHESLLEYFENQLKEHERRHGTELGFHLTATQCQSLREEAQMYYQRYLSLFVLEDFPGVVRDTARNLRVLDFCGKFAVEEADRLMLEQFRPYIVMMNARAMASIAFKEERFADALKTVQEAIDSIHEFFEAMGQPEASSKSNEVRVLKRFARDIRKRMPVDPVQKLQSQLDRAVKSERYEDAARLRDEIRRQTGANGGA